MKTMFYEIARWAVALAAVVSLLVMFRVAAAAVIPDDALDDQPEILTGIIFAGKIEGIVALIEQIHGNFAVPCAQITFQIPDLYLAEE